MRPLTLACLLLLALAPLARAADAPPRSPLDTAIDQYMAGKWDDLDQTLKANTKDLNALTGQPKLDLAYIRQSLAETRPPWWKVIKASTARVTFRPIVWGRTPELIFDPAGKGGVQTQYTGTRATITVSWPAADMDNPVHAEHGFSKGELNNLNVFATLGMAAAWADLPPSALLNLNEDQKTLLFRSMDLAGNVTGVYYASPRARRWGLWLYMHSYLEKYAKMQTINARKAVAAAVLAELLANPAKYPSIKLPASLEPDNAEEKLALAVHTKIEKTGWTLPEDKALRDALKAFATANPAVIRQGGTVKLPGGMTMNLDPDKDAPLKPKRDAWFKTQFDKPRPAPTK